MKLKTVSFIAMSALIMTGASASYGGACNSAPPCGGGSGSTCTTGGGSFSSAEWAKKKKKLKKQEILKKYDKDDNGKLDEDEASKARKEHVEESLINDLTSKNSAKAN